MSITEKEYVYFMGLDALKNGLTGIVVYPFHSVAPVLDRPLISSFLCESWLFVGLGRL